MTITAYNAIEAAAAEHGWLAEPGTSAFERVYRKTRGTYLRVTYDVYGRVVEGCTAKTRLGETGKRERALAILAGAAR